METTAEISTSGPKPEAEMQKADPQSSSLFIKKFSIFDPAFAQQAIQSIVEVAEGFNNEQQDLELDSYVRQSSKTKAIEEADAQLQSLSMGEKFVCTTCNFQFADREDQIGHFRCDLHLFNIKQKLRGKPICPSIEEFEQLSDISSISGSDTEDEESGDFSSTSEEDESGSSKSKPINVNTASYVTIARGKPKISFKLKDSNVLVMLRCLLHGKKNIPEKQEELLSLVKSISPADHWCIVLIAAGHFAAAVFKGDELVVHKTFHRYVVRAKRGTVQSQHDSHRHAKSAGANIRRHHEAAFKEDIRLLLGTEWKTQLDSCKCIFIRVPRYNRPVLVTTNTSAGQGGNASKAPFDKSDPRLRNIPFMTFRPTLNEVKRTHTLLSKVELFKPEYIDLTTKLAEKRIEKETPKKPKSSPKPAETADLSKKKQKKKKVKPESDNEDSDEDLDEGEEDEEDDLQVHNQDFSAEPARPVTTNGDFIQSLDAGTLKYFNEFYTCCLTNNSQKLSDKIAEFKSSQQSTSSSLETLESVEKLLNKRVNKENGFTLLHLSSELGNHECVWQLLLNGADPSQPDLTRQNRVPYNIASNKQSRDQFRLFMNDYPDRYDYSKARVPGPLSREKLNEKTEKEKEKRKQQRKLKRERQAESKKIENEKDWEEKERQKFLSLTDEQKRALTNPNPTPASEFMAAAAAAAASNMTASSSPSSFSSVPPAPGSAKPASSSSQKPALPKLRVANRCWFCAIDISELSQPFEYFDYKFCSARCLRAHRYLPKTGANSSK